MVLAQLGVLTAVVLSQAVSAPLSKLAVLDLSAVGDGRKELEPKAELLTSLTLAEVNRLGRFKAIGRQDVSALLGLERQRQLLGCSDAASSCLGELAGALGVDFVLTGTLGRLGQTYRVDLKLLAANSAEARGSASADVIAGDDEAFLGAVERLVRQLTASVPPPPGWVEPPLRYAKRGGAGLAVGFGIAAGVLALTGLTFGLLAKGSYDAEVREAMGGDRMAYDAALAAVRWQAPVADVAFVAAALAAGAAVVFTVRALASGPSVAFVPRPDGAAFVLGGVFE